MSNPLAQIRDGIDIGVRARHLMTELRLKGMTVADIRGIERPDSPYYETYKKIDVPISSLMYFGLIVGQLRQFREWYANADYFFGNP